jgi:AraC family transcriptional regulator
VKAVAETIAAIGNPVLLQTVGNPTEPTATIARWRHNGCEVTITPADTVRVAISLQTGHHVRHESATATMSADVAVGSVTVMPADFSARIAVQGEADVLQIFLRETFVKAAVGGRFECPALLDSHDSELQAAAMQLLVAAIRGDPDDPLLLEAGVHRIAARLRHQEAEAAGPAQGGLSRAACRRVEEMIVASLENCAVPSPTLEQMADAARLSVNHFIRAFRQQTGVTPHRHVVLRRLERGITLLKAPGVSIAEVADGVGFATPAHFVATFRRTMGVTPGAFRAALCG